MSYQIFFVLLQQKYIFIEMGKIVSVYKNGVDKAWFNSSTIVYAECIDKQDSLKEVKVVFKNGSEYSYYDVKVQDYLMFREDASQGKALNKFIKGYEYKKSEEKRDLEQLNEEMDALLVQTQQILEEQKDLKSDTSPD